MLSSVPCCCVNPHSAVKGTVGSCIQSVSLAVTLLHAQASPAGGLRQRVGRLVLPILDARRPSLHLQRVPWPACRQRDFISQTDLLQPSSRAAYAWDEPEQAHMLQLGLDGRILADCPLDQASGSVSCTSSCSLVLQSLCLAHRLASQFS